MSEINLSISGYVEVDSAGFTVENDNWSEPKYTNLQLAAIWGLLNTTATVEFRTAFKCSECPALKLLEKNSQGLIIEGENTKSSWQDRNDMSPRVWCGALVKLINQTEQKNIKPNCVGNTISKSFHIGA